MCQILITIPFLIATRFISVTMLIVYGKEGKTFVYRKLITSYLRTHG